MENMSPIQTITKVNTNNQENITNARDATSYEAGDHTAFANTLRQQMQHQSNNEANAKAAIKSKANSNAEHKAVAGDETTETGAEKLSADKANQELIALDANVADANVVDANVVDANNIVDTNVIVATDWLSSVVAARENLASQVGTKTNEVIMSAGNVGVANLDVTSVSNKAVLSNVPEKPILVDSAARVANNAIVPTNTVAQSLVNQANIASINSTQKPVLAQNTEEHTTSVTEFSIGFTEQLQQVDEGSTARLANAQSNFPVGGTGVRLAPPALAYEGKQAIVGTNESFAEQLQQFDDLSALLPNQAPSASGTTTSNLSPIAQAQFLSTHIEIPVGLKGWHEAMNNQVIKMAQQGDDLATLTLSPPDLGKVQVVLRVDNQSVDTTFISDNPNVRQALEDGLQDLKARMLSQGLQLGSTFVGNGDQAQQHFEAQTPRTLTDNTEALDKQAEAVVANVLRPRQLQGLVDTFA